MLLGGATFLLLTACSAAGADDGAGFSTGGLTATGGLSGMGGTPGSGGFVPAGGVPGGGGFAPASGGAGSASGGTGVVPMGGASSGPFGGYDPNVVFDWPEVAQTGTCKGGKYLGSFEGIYSPGIAFVPGVPVPVTGNIELTLSESADGEFFEIQNGKVSGLADLAFPFEAAVKGTLNCTTSKLELGFLENGTYLIGPLPYNFAGPISCNYDKLTHAFAGCTWKVGEPTWSDNPAPLFGGSGTWEAKWTL
jgi:hypothetical protein